MSEMLCIDELLSISKNIDDCYEKLMYLSRMNKEESDEYNSCLRLLHFNVMKSVVFCETQSVETLQKMVQILNVKIKDNPDDYYYSAAMNAVSFVLNEKLVDSSSKCEQDECMEMDEMIDETYQDEMVDYEKYFEDDYEEELDSYYDEAMSMIYLEATKKVITRIKSTYVTNDYESNYKKMLLKEYKEYYKYDFLSSNILLELKAINSRFNPFNIDIKIDRDYSPLYYNQAIEVISYLYDRSRNNTSPTEVCEDLFSVLVVETIVDLLDDDRLNKLNELCEEKSSKYNLSNYGDICHIKVKQKLK